MKVLATNEVIDYWENLITILFEKEYFGSEEFAQRYVDELLIEIKTKLSYRISKPAPKRFDKYGEKLRYASFKKSKRTHGTYFLKRTRKMMK